MREPPRDPGGCTLAALDETWLKLYCAKCRRTVLPPLKLLGQRYGRQKHLRDILPRFACKDCRQRPASIHLQQSATHGAPGMAAKDGGWRIRLGLGSG